MVVLRDRTVSVLIGVLVEKSSVASKQADVVSRRWEGKKRKEVKCREKDTPRTDKLPRDNFSGGLNGLGSATKRRSFVAANFFGKEEGEKRGGRRKKPNTALIESVGSF